METKASKRQDWALGGNSPQRKEDSLHGGWAPGYRLRGPERGPALSLLLGEPYVGTTFPSFFICKVGIIRPNQQGRFD